MLPTAWPNCSQTRHKPDLYRSDLHLKPASRNIGDKFMRNFTNEGNCRWRKFPSRYISLFTLDLLIRTKKKSTRKSVADPRGLQWARSWDQSSVCQHPEDKISRADTAQSTPTISVSLTGPMTEPKWGSSILRAVRRTVRASRSPADLGLGNSSFANGEHAALEMYRQRAHIHIPVGHMYDNNVRTTRSRDVRRGTERGRPTALS